MSAAWDDLDLRRQAKLVLECIPLTQTQYEMILAEWAKRKYAPGQEKQALADLQQMASWESLPEHMREQERQRRAKEKQQWQSR